MAAPSLTVIVLQHGLLGTTKDLESLACVIHDRFPDALVLNSPVSPHLWTYLGIEFLGRRFARWLREVLKPYRSGARSQRKFVRLCFVGHSLGGLIIRASLRWLHQYGALHPHYVELCSYVSIATPHLGIRRHYASATLFNRLAMGICAAFGMGYTGRELMLLDGTTRRGDPGDGGSLGVPLLVRLADPHGPYFRHLAAFRGRTTLAMLQFDWQVPFCSAAMRPSDVVPRDEQSLRALRRAASAAGFVVTELEDFSVSELTALSAPRKPYADCLWGALLDRLGHRALRAGESTAAASMDGAANTSMAVPFPEAVSSRTSVVSDCPSDVDRIDNHEKVEDAVVSIASSSAVDQARSINLALSTLMDCARLEEREATGRALILRNSDAALHRLSRVEASARGVAGSSASPVQSISALCTQVQTIASIALPGPLQYVLSLFAALLWRCISTVAILLFAGSWHSSVDRIRRTLRILRICGIPIPFHWTLYTTSEGSAVGREAESPETTQLPVCDVDSEEFVSCNYREFVYPERAMRWLGSLPWRRVPLWMDGIMCHDVVVGKVELPHALLGYRKDDAAPVSSLVADIIGFDVEASIAAGRKNNEAGGAGHRSGLSRLSASGMSRAESLCSFASSDGLPDAVEGHAAEESVSSVFLPTPGEFTMKLVG